jgi:hypothetical protein
VYSSSFALSSGAGGNDYGISMATAFVSDRASSDSKVNGRWTTGVTERRGPVGYSQVIAVIAVYANCAGGCILCLKSATRSLEVLDLFQPTQPTGPLLSFKWRTNWMFFSGHTPSYPPRLRPTERMAARATPNYGVATTYAIAQLLVPSYTLASTVFPRNLDCSRTLKILS